jgi:two-component system, OmpR family, response regulator
VYSRQVKVPFLGRILIVDDEPKIRSFIGRALTAAGYHTDFAENGAEGLQYALASHYDLVILDLLMPDLDGRQVLGTLLRARPQQAVIVLSCVADVAAKVDCLERGAQDYLTKPFSLAELLARVRLRMRREACSRPAVAVPCAVLAAHLAPVADVVPAPMPTLVPSPRPASVPTARGYDEVIKVGTVTLDVGRLVADIGQGPVPLTRLETLLLRELAEHAGQSVPKGRLLATVWGYDFDPGSNVVDVCVRRVRSKLGFNLIKTVRGEGYQLVSS